jgi:hypothetical protein
LDNVSVEVFERDYSPTDRLQGYRLSIDATGGKALRSCLPRALFENLMNRLLAIDFPQSDRKCIDTELPVSRIALRRILLEGLGPDIHFGKKFVAFEDAPDGAVTAVSKTGRPRRATCLSVRTVPALICARSSCPMLGGPRPGFWLSAENST